MTQPTLWHQHEPVTSVMGRMGVTWIMCRRCGEMLEVRRG